MNRKGIIGYVLIFGIVAVFVLVGIIIFAISFFGKIETRLGFFDSNVSVAESQTGFVGVNLFDGKLKYYDGSKWKEINEDLPNFRINDYTFVPKNSERNGLKDQLFKFYVETPRDPEKIIFEFNHWRYWEAEKDKINWVDVIISDKKKKGYEPVNSDHLETLNYIINPRDDLAPTNDRNKVGWDHGAELLDVINEQQDIGFAKSVVGDWRDQFLEGGECERFMELKVVVDGREEVKHYKVKKEFEYLYIDLNEEVKLGEVEKYERGCFFKNQQLTVSYDDSIFNNLNWKNNAEVSVEVFGNDLYGEANQQYVYKNNQWVNILNDRYTHNFMTINGVNLLDRGFLNIVDSNKDAERIVIKINEKIIYDGPHGGVKMNYIFFNEYNKHIIITRNHNGEING